MKKVGIIGHFGLGKNLANGQTIKTKIIANELEKKYNGSVAIVDTHGGIKRLFKVVKQTISLIKQCDNVIIMTTENGLKALVPVMFYKNKKYKKKLHYIVIGGWLEKFLKSNKSIMEKLRFFDCIYVETSVMRSQLKKLGFNNVLVMPNCKKLDIVKKNKLNIKYKEPFKICTFSRVMKEKGIDDAVETIIKINTEYNRTVYKLDIYGQIDDYQVQWFENLKKKFPNYINYCGVVDFDKTTNILKDYFLLLFPTKFYTEGIPGTIIDSYASGVPVISSKWESFADIVEDGITGYGYEFGDIDEMYNLLKKIIIEPTMITNLKQNCIEKAEEYKIDEVMKILFMNIK